jgi:hypothetical protein
MKGERVGALYGQGGRRFTRILCTSKFRSGNGFGVEALN